MGPSGLFIAIFLLICLSAFCSLAETSFVSAPEEKLFKLAQDGNKGAKAVLKLFADKKNPNILNKDKVINIALLCDNLANILASSLSAVFFAEQFGEYDEIGILLSTTIMTILVFVFGEVLPKMVAVRQATKWAIRLAPSFNILSIVLLPALWVINRITAGVMRIFQIKNEQENADADETLLDAVEMYHQQGALENNEKEMLSGILQLDEVDFKDIMTHRSEMVAVDINETKEQIIDKIMNTPFTKIPFYDKSDDNMVGVLNVGDLMREMYKNKDFDKVDIKKILQQPWYLPGDASVSKHLQEFKDRSNALAFVVDEYGGIMGIVSLEDIIEEIVGDIKSNEQDKPAFFKKNEDGSFIVEADMGLSDLNDAINSDFIDNEVSSIGGFIIHKIDHIPAKSESFDIDGYNFLVLETKANRILKLKIKKLEVENDNDK